MEKDAVYDSLLDDIVGNDNEYDGPITSDSSAGTDSGEDVDILDDLMGGMLSGQENNVNKVSENKEQEVAHEPIIKKEKEQVVKKTAVLPTPGTRKKPLFGANKPATDTKVDLKKVDNEPKVIESTKKANVVNVSHTAETKSIDELIDDEMSSSSVDGLLSSMENVDGVSLSDQTDAIVPLDRPEMSKVKVTPDGRTLAEMLPGLRGGNRPLDKVIEDIKDEEKDVVVNGKKRSDTRYIKHGIAIENIVDEQEQRKALSNKFLQKNAKYTEEEKIIMKNLGVTNDQFAKLMKKGRLSKEQKQEVLAVGKYGPERFFKGRKYRTTVGDAAILEYLAKFKFANARILRWLRDEPQGRTRRKLNRLKENGLVENKSVIGLAELWANTSAGNAVAGYSFKPALYKMPKMVSISATLGPNYLAACLWFNTVNVLNLDDFPAHNRVIALQEDGRDRARGEMLVSELEIRSSLGKEINPEVSTMYAGQRGALYDVIANTVRMNVRKWEQNGKQGEGPETELGNEYMWVLYPQNSLTRHYHVPDLVVKRDRGPNGEPKSIAVEVERYAKGNNSYKQIMLAYKLDKHLYEKVVWVTPNSSVARQLQQAAEEVGFTNYDIVPIITKDGTFDKPDIWTI